MKKSKIIITISVLLVSVILCSALVMSQDTVKYKIDIFRAEQEYKKSGDSSDLIHLVLALQKDGYFDKAITYSRELIDVITEEGIMNSELSNTSYIELLENNSPRDIAIDVYLFTIMNAKEYELYTKEFVEFYPQTSSDIRYNIDVTPIEAYERTSDQEVLNAAVKGYLEVAETTDDLLKAQCESHAKKLQSIADGTLRTQKKTGDG